ncbi:MAG: NAD(P)/FAD-dependent oxidoreductase [Thermoproteus sp.]
MKAAVVGGGIAGVFTAYFLREAGIDVVGFGGELRYPLTSLVLTLSMPDPRDVEMAVESLEIYRKMAAIEPVTSVDIMPTYADLSSLRRAGVKYQILDRFRGLRLARDEMVVVTTDYLIPIRKIVASLRRRLGFSDKRAALGAKGRRVYLVVDGRHVDADAVILAAGADNRELALRIGVDLPFRPYSCYAAAFLVPGWLRGLSIGDYVLSWYGRPGPWPLYIAGDGCGKAYSNPPRGYASKIARLIARRAGWALPLYAKSGVCEGSPTGGPLAGKVGRFDNLYVIGGLDGYGSMVGPAVARRLAELVVKGRAEDLPDLPDAFDFDPCVERHDWSFSLRRS